MHFNSGVTEIQSDTVTIAIGDETKIISNDAVIISAGGILPSTFLREIGISVETKWGSE